MVSEPPPPMLALGALRDGEARSMTDVATLLDLDVPTVERLMRDLEAAGMIAPAPRH